MRVRSSSPQPPAGATQASETDLIIARAGAAADRLREFGVTAPIEVTADNAFTFIPDPADAGLFDRLWPEAGNRVMGLALVDFYLFPVVMRPWGPKEDCYKWPYYYSLPPEERVASDELAALTRRWPTTSSASTACRWR